MPYLKQIYMNRWMKHWHWALKWSCVFRAIRLDAGQRGSRCPPFSMSAVRTPVFIGLLLLILTTGYCRLRDRDDTSLLDLLRDRVRLAQEHQSEGNPQHPPELTERSAETKDVNKVTKSHQHERILGKHHHIQSLTKWDKENWSILEFRSCCLICWVALHILWPI